MKRLLLFVLLFFGVTAWATVPDIAFTVSYTCTGSTGPFSFAFPISDATAMTVTQNGTLLNSTQYTIIPVNNNYDNGGLVTLVSSCAGGQTLVLARMTPVTQTVKFYDNMPIPMATFERGLDKLTEISQELKDISGVFGGITIGNLTPLFTTTVTSPTSSPVVTFNLSNAGAGTLFGNLTGSPASPSFNSFSISGTKCYLFGGSGGAGCDIPSGVGTVTTVSIGNLSPLFTASATNPTSTPAIAFVLANAGANTIFGNFTNSSTTPSYNAVSACGDSSHALSWVPGTGFACQAITIGSGTVTGVAMTGDGVVFNTSVSGSPITTSGTLAPSLHTQSANLVLAGPTSGGAVGPTFRSLVDLDLPNTAVTPGSYTATNLTVDQQGRITAAANGISIPSETDGDIIYGAASAWTKGTALPSGITATTQSANDNSTKVATTAYADAVLTTAQKTRTVCVNDLAPSTGDDGLITILNPATAIHIKRFSCGVQGSTSVIANMVKGGDSLIADATCTNGDANTVVVTAFVNGSGQCGGTGSCAVSAHAPVTIHVGTLSGTPTSLNICTDYTVD